MHTYISLIALALALLWAFFGWQKGSVFEMRGLLVAYFSVLGTFWFWYPLTTIVEDMHVLNQKGSAVLVFAVLIFSWRVLVSYLLNNNANNYKPTADNTPDKWLGAVVGFASGLLMWSSLALMVTVYTARPLADSSKPEVKRIEQLPIAMLRFVEKLASVPADSAALIPQVQADPNRPKQTMLVWK